MYLGLEGGCDTGRYIRSYADLITGRCRELLPTLHPVPSDPSSHCSSSLHCKVTTNENRSLESFQHDDSWLIDLYYY